MYDNEPRGRKGEKRFLQSPLVNVIVKVVAVGIFTVSLLISLTFIILLIIVGVSVGTGDRLDAGYRKVYRDVYTDVYRDVKRPISGRTITDEIAVVYLNGIITDYDQRDGIFGYIESPLSAVRNRFNVIRSDEYIKGILLVIDSPGGGVTASDALFNFIMRYRSETGLPIVSLMKKVAASGGYYVAAASDTIVAYPTAITGSIGVIMYSFNFTGLMEKYGVKYVAIKTSESKDSMSPFKPVEPGEIAWMQTIVDKMNKRFIEAVALGRANLTKEQVGELADGKVYIAQDALEKGLIDSVGYFEDAVRILSQKAGIEKPVIVEYERERSFRDILGRMIISLPRSLFQEEIIERVSVRPFELYYLWDAALTLR